MIKPAMDTETLTLDYSISPHRATMSSKGQVVIPAAIRHELGIEPGMFLVMRVAEGRIVMVPQKRLTWRDLRGITAGGPSMTDELLEDRRLERERELREEGW
ncbi:AbrB/MazE/SpoVT family DNA-binding domain-containing protein [Terracidiphilus sp.]|jgi:AbrB family looped-hinge helix DNA binding protein|uniref:AbrB/MazE/SpoVT family DNA-binding domain-containing protein n=1 Tax=Terracidiphilus sp. TaxID=1964191 RepID=UPI003C285D4F